MKRALRPGHPRKRSGRVKRGAEILISRRTIHDGPCPLAVAPGEDAAAGGGEGEAQGDANIDVGGITHDAVVHGPDRLEEHGKEEPVRDLFLGGRMAVGVVLVLALRPKLAPAPAS